MTHRFVKLPICFSGEDDENQEVYTTDLHILPLTIESYMPIDITFTELSGNLVERQGTKIITKSGNEYDVLLSIDEFHEAVKHF